MDERTKEKLLKAARIRMRLLEGRASGLPYGADWMRALEEGRIAADRLEAEMVRQELHRVKELAESLRMDRDAARALIAERDALRATVTVTAKPASLEDDTPPQAIVEGICAHCGRRFVPHQWQQTYCSRACRTATHRAKQAARRAVATPLLPAPLMHYCERMSLRQLSPLPCGKRMECFGEPRCERCPEEAAPVLPPRCV